MTPAQKLDALATAYTTKKVADAREEITIINDTSPIAEDIKNIQMHQLNQETGQFEQDYDFMKDACYILSDIALADLKDADLYELTSDTASVYTATRLSWLNNQNQDDITQILKEYECDIATACAVYYDRNVQAAAELIREWILTV